ncbi:2-isopropylmalate synthase [Stomatohabitans albus]|uniref:2-isopropylmalate synthase n=1 Tax=Stomatohabitans albus TaxID=3110766 RepID=UPI00300DA284
MAHVTIFDTTLRDGEQSPGISLDPSEKLEIAHQLARLGVDVIEAGFPVASDGDFLGVQQIAKEVGNLPNAPVICGLARATEGDVRRCAEAIAPAATSRLHVFISTSDIHRQEMLKGASEADIIALTTEMVSLATTLADQVEFSAQDATRTETGFLKEVLKAAVDAGAHTINVPDTVGFTMPSEYGDLIEEIVALAGDAVVSVHCHNDLGLAVANSLEAVRRGAGQIEVAINGIGERAGNCSLEEVVMGMTVRHDLIGKDTRINTKEIGRTSKLVAQLTGYPVQYNKAVVGRNAFAHESGIHQHGVLANRATYEIMTAEDLGLVGAQLILGKHSGRHAFVQALRDLGITLDEARVDDAFAQFKAVADRKREVTADDLEAIVVDTADVGSEVWTIEMAQMMGGIATAPTATVRVRHVAEDRAVTEAAVGDGMIDAICRAISRACGVDDAHLEDFRVSSITAGRDALGDVTVTIRRDGTTYTGRGLSTDVVEATGRAWLEALNRSERLRDARKGRTHSNF